MKKLIYLIIPAMLLFACNNVETKKNDEGGCCSSNEETASICKDVISIEALLEDIDSYVDKEVSICGNCSHVCDHSGKNIFVESFENSEILIIGKAGEKIETFDKKFENTHVVLRGTLRAVEVENEDELEVHHDIKLTYYIEVSEILNCSCGTKCTGNQKNAGCCSGKTSEKCCGGHTTEAGCKGKTEGGCKGKKEGGCKGGHNHE